MHCHMTRSPSSSLRLQFDVKSQYQQYAYFKLKHCKTNAVTHYTHFDTICFYTYAYIHNLLYNIYQATNMLKRYIPSAPCDKIHNINIEWLSLNEFPTAEIISDFILSCLTLCLRCTDILKF